MSTYLEFGLHWYVNVANTTKINVCDVLDVPIIRISMFSADPAACIIYLMIQTVDSYICDLNQITWCHISGDHDHDTTRRTQLSLLYSLPCFFFIFLLSISFPSSSSSSLCFLIFRSGFPSSHSSLLSLPARLSLVYQMSSAGSSQHISHSDHVYVQFLVRSKAPTPSQALR